MRHRHGKADARAQAGLFKDHRERLPGQDRIVLARQLILMLQLLRDVQDMTKLGGRTLCKRSEMIHEEPLRGKFEKRNLELRNNDE